MTREREKALREAVEHFKVHGRAIGIDGPQHAKDVEELLNAIDCARAVVAYMIGEERKACLERDAWRSAVERSWDGEVET